MKLTLSILAIITILFIDFIKALQFKHLFGKKREREKGEKREEEERREGSCLLFLFQKPVVGDPGLGVEDAILECNPDY